MTQAEFLLFYIKKRFFIAVSISYSCLRTVTSSKRITS